MSGAFWLKTLVSTTMMVSLQLNGSFSQYFIRSLKGFPGCCQVKKRTSLHDILILPHLNSNLYVFVCFGCKKYENSKHYRLHNVLYSDLSTYELSKFLNNFISSLGWKLNHNRIGFTAFLLSFFEPVTRVLPTSLHKSLCFSDPNTCLNRSLWCTFAGFWRMKYVP